MDKKTILVTGGAGMIGSNLAMELQRLGHKVIVLDNFTTGTWANLKGFNGKIITGDITNRHKLSKLMRDECIDQIYHLAATSSSQMFERDLTNSMQNNILGTLNVFEAARRNCVEKVVYASTSTVYAKNKPPYKEDMVVSAENYYALTKLSNEHLGHIYAKEKWVKNVGLRFFSVYGPNDQNKGKFGNLLTQFMNGMGHGMQPTVYGRGEQGRDFVYVLDVCRAMIAAMNSKANDIVLNVGTGKQTNILDLIKMINKLLGKNIKPRFEENPIKGYVVYHQADTSLMEKTLKFKPEISLQEGLKRLKEVLFESSSGKQ